MIDSGYLRERLLAIDRKCQRIRIEVDLHFGRCTVLVPAMRVAPCSQGEPLLGIAGEEALKLIRHGYVEVAIGLVLRVQKDNAGLVAFGEDVVEMTLSDGSSGAGAVGPGDGTILRRCRNGL